MTYFHHFFWTIPGVLTWVRALNPWVRCAFGNVCWKNVTCPLRTTNIICAIILCPMSTKMFYSVSRYVISELPGSFVFVFFIKLPVPSEQTLPKPKVSQATSLQHSVAKHMTNVSIRQPTIRIITKCRMNEKDHVNAAPIEFLLQMIDWQGWARTWTLRKVKL